MIGLVGPNGAGKTTLMRILCGIVAPTRGRVLADGRDLSDARARRALKRTLGYLPQDIEPYPNLTPLEFLDYMGVLKGMGDARERRRQAGGAFGARGAGRCRAAGASAGSPAACGGAWASRKRSWATRGCSWWTSPRPGWIPRSACASARSWRRSEAERTVILSTHILDDVAQTCPYVCVLRGGRLRYDGTTSGLVDAARGRTWITPPLAAPPRRRRRGQRPPPPPEGTRYRVVTDAPPANAQPAEPTLEDGYLALVAR